MARASVLGNGSTLVCLDSSGQVRDLYYPYAGQENHIGPNQMHKVGIFVDNGMHWLDNGSWQTNTEYIGKSMSAKVVSTNDACGIRLEAETIVYNEKNIFLRKFVIKNDSDRKREIKLFCNQQFKIGDTNHADTAYFSNTIESIIHYKGRRVFLVGGLCDNRAFDDYSIGFCGIEGKEGTWKDAEDGKLSKNPIEHGIVDSVIEWGKTLDGGGVMTVYYWITIGETYRETVELLNYIFEKSPEHLLESTRDFWEAWSGQMEVIPSGFSEKVQKLFYASLSVMRAHSDNHGGILASADSGNVQYGGDTYSYVWPRDACFVARVFDEAGFYDVSRRFYDFANNVVTEDGYVLHKYQPDRSLGSSWHPWVKDGKRQLAIQEDETAIILIGLWEHYAKAKDLEFIEGLYNNLIKRSADFLIRYRDQDTNLPLPSYDLWEERYGVFPFTVSLVYGALVSAGRFAKVLGKEEEARHFNTEAESVRKALLKELWDEKSRSFSEIVEVDGKLQKQQRVDASSFYGPWRFGVFATDDPRLFDFYKLVKNALSRGVRVGGVARYDGDKYCRDTEEVPGNPWFVTTLWLAQYKISNASSLSELGEVAKDIEWVAGLSFFEMLSEQIHPETGRPLSATPLVWSHAEFVRTVIEYQKKLESLSNKIK